ncbi:MAG: four helix bundle suffix domain-containing protein [Candidatus Hydrogenedentes bacterium]|nr:four helix bundle suffix domain-containing protein [Candidatus Hydrogenedentota bacterium]
MPDAESILPKHGGYKRLKTYQISRLVYDVTVRFCDRYIAIRSRTHDQMVQAARSGVQNIVEGSQASATSRKIEMKLTGIARASLEELRKDYEDFLRHRKLARWENADPRRAALVACRCSSADDVAAWVRETHDRETSGSNYPEIAANAALVLINVACSLLDRQLASQARAFENEGGITERMYRVRTERRRAQGGP